MLFRLQRRARRGSTPSSRCGKRQWCSARSMSCVSRPSLGTRPTPSASGSTPASRTSTTSTSCLTSCRGAISWMCWSPRPKLSNGGYPRESCDKLALLPRWYPPLAEANQIETLQTLLLRNGAIRSSSGKSIDAFRAEDVRGGSA